MAQPTSDESDALARLDRVHGPGGMKAALLAVLLVPDQPGRLRAWREETSLVGEAETIREDVERLGAAVRLPWFELLLARLGGTPLHDRQGLLRSARRVLTAAHPGLPIDRLLWLAMRRHFGENPYALVHAPAEAEIAQLPPADMRHVADYTAHLARMVPSDDPAAGHGLDGRIDARQVDLDAGLPAGADRGFDLVICQRFRDQRLYPQLVDALAPGGLLVITVLSEVGTPEPGPFHAPAGELTRAFADAPLDVLLDREGDGAATLVGRRRGDA